MYHHRNNNINDYKPFIGEEKVRQIHQKAKEVQGLHVANVNSTYYGGGVSQLLSSLTLLLNSVGIKTGWRVVHGPPDFFSVTKKIHNALQGGDINLSERKKQLYETVVYENAMRNHLDHDLIIIHDPQPLPIIDHYRKKSPWVWRCHIDLSNPHKQVWDYLVPFIEKYDAVILSSHDYMQNLNTPQIFFMPAIDPFTITNRELPQHEIEERLRHYNIPTDLPIVTQISRFDRWKDPEGVVKAFKLARKEVDCTLVMLGNVATDDPEGAEVYSALSGYREDRIIILTAQDGALVNALQRKAAVVIQKSIQEGFGLTVTEAMWKGAAVVGGNTGGIRNQIEDGVNGFLVSSIEETAERIVQLVKDKYLKEQLGQKARETVRQNFLITRLLEQYLDLFNSFQATFSLTDKFESND